METGLTRFVEWVPALAGASLIFGLQTLAGGVLLGVAPASKVLAHTVQSRLDDQPLTFRESWRLWATSWKESQLRLGVPLLQLIPLGLWLLMTRNSVWLVSVVIFGLVLMGWLLVLAPLQERLLEASAPLTWLAAAQLLARHPFLVLGTIAIIVAAFIAFFAWLPLGLIVWGPGLAALAAELAYRACEGHERKSDLAG